MTTAIVDTTVIVHLFRRYSPALQWYSTIKQSLGITPITWTEIIYGAGSKVKQADCKTMMLKFDLIHLTTTDQNWAMKQMEIYRLSHGITTNDCFIAATAYRLQIPLYTHNLKDMVPLIGQLAVKPYT